MENTIPVTSPIFPLYHRPAQSTASAPKALAVFCTFLIGTGGAYTLDRVDEWQHHLKGRVPLILETPERFSRVTEHPDIRSAAAHIENIRNTLSPAVSDLAALFDVSRQAVYKWQSGESTPEPDKLDRIVELSRIADALRIAGVSRPGDLLKMKAFNGRSLMELIKARESSDKHIQALVDEAKAMEDSYKQSGLMASKAKPTNDWQTSFSIPGSIEQG